MTEIMKSARHQPFSGSRLPDQQHGAIQIAHAPDHLVELVHGIGLSDQSKGINRQGSGHIRSSWD